MINKKKFLRDTSSPIIKQNKPENESKSVQLSLFFLQKVVTPENTTLKIYTHVIEK